MTDMGPSNFVLLHPDGRVEFYDAEDRAVAQYMKAHIPDTSSQGMGRLRAWFTDSFTTDTPRNRLADAVLSGIGYHHPTGWFGLVGLTMEERPDGAIPPMPPEVHAAILDVAEAGAARFRANEP